MKIFKWKQKETILFSFFQEKYSTFHHHWYPSFPLDSNLKLDSPIHFHDTIVAVHLVWTQSTQNLFYLKEIFERNESGRKTNDLRTIMKLYSNYSETIKKLYVMKIKNRNEKEMTLKKYFLKWEWFENVFTFFRFINWSFQLLSSHSFPYLSLLFSVSLNPFFYTLWFSMEKKKDHNKYHFFTSFSLIKIDSLPLVFMFQFWRKLLRQKRERSTILFVCLSNIFLVFETVFLHLWKNKKYFLKIASQILKRRFDTIPFSRFFTNGESIVKV